ncbi:MAG TPA: divalent metal cation transporter, partial [Desulfobacterales bacterium]|nr:divalent metal cation transporter [Desulfobacterales bacterium]
NLFLHSALVQSRAVSNTFTGKNEACRYNLIDSVVALNAAFLVNAAILITAAACFYSRGIAVTEIQQAHEILDRLMGESLARSPSRSHWSPPARARPSRARLRGRWSRRASSTCAWCPGCGGW